MMAKTTVGDANLINPNAKNSYEITQDDLPVHCPMPGSSLWNSHPQVFIAFNAEGKGKCPYCGADYHISE
ncbi:hypothetical protein MNBD_GAMMA09-566 [hydrothermal vent metagenome]|uniref:Zinc finger CHCC-type domain-containing protein n=1 Tax=hydrothermal vent metagenome TaxID=652676 RepID=A0A3B0XM99_9ZZZZ